MGVAHPAGCRTTRSLANLALRCRRQKARIEYCFRGQFAWQLEALGDQIEMFAQACRIREADAGLTHARGGDEVERPFEAPELDRGLRQRLGPLESGNGSIGVGSRTLP